MGSGDWRVRIWASISPFIKLSGLHWPSPRPLRSRRCDASSVVRQAEAELLALPLLADGRGQVHLSKPRFLLLSNRGDCLTPRAVVGIRWFNRHLPHISCGAEGVIDGDASCYTRDRCESEPSTLFTRMRRWWTGNSRMLWYWVSKNYWASALCWALF